jgi:hypothetical protein
LLIVDQVVANEQFAEPITGHKLAHPP